MKSNNWVTLFAVFLVLAKGSQSATDAEEQEAKNDELMKPYKFGYEIQDEKGNVQHRHEQSDGKMQTGSYGYLDANGKFRKVIYIADKDGFRARLDSNEGIANVDSANAIYRGVKPDKNLSIQPLNSSLTNKDINDNLIDVGKSSSNHHLYTNLPANTNSPIHINIAGQPAEHKNATSKNQYLSGDESLLNDTKQWVHLNLNKIKNEEPVFTNEKIYMQLIPEAKLKLEHKAPSKTEFIQLSNSPLHSNASILNSTWETNQVFADSLNTANSRNFPFRYQNPPKNRKYEPFVTNKNEAIYLNNEEAVNDYPKQQKKKVYFSNANNNYPPKHPLDHHHEAVRLKPTSQPTIVHNPNQHYVSNKLLKNDLNINHSNYSANNRDYSLNNNYKQPTKLEYEEVRTSLNSQLPSILQQDQNNESNKPREFYVKPSNTFYVTDPDPPAVQYNQLPPKPIYKPIVQPPVNTNLVQSEPSYLQDKSIYKKQKVPVYNLDQSPDSHAVKPKQHYSNNKPAYPPYEYHFHMPGTNKQADRNSYSKNEFTHNNRRPLLQPQTEEYAPPLPSPKPYATQNSGTTQSRSIGSASTNPELVKPTYLTGFTPVITEHKFSRPVTDDYHPLPPKQPIYKPKKLLQQPKIYKENGNNKYNFQLLNSGLISINELDNQVDREKITPDYPNSAYSRPQQSPTNKLEQPQFVTASNELGRINQPTFENLILPENKAYVYPENDKPPSNNHITTNTYTATPSNEDEVMYEKYKSMIRSRLPNRNLVYKPYERLVASPNYAYNVSGNHNQHENELTPYNYQNLNSQLLNGHSTNHETYNNSQPNDYVSYNPNNVPKEATPIFFSKYTFPEGPQQPSSLEENDPDLYNPEGAVRYSIKKYLGKNLKNRRYFKPHSNSKLYLSNRNGNYEVIGPNRFNNGLINAKEDNLIDRSLSPQSNRLNLIEHNYLHNYATSASNPTINKFKYNLKSLLPKMDKSISLPYGGIDIEELENKKGKLKIQKILIKDTLHQKSNPREIRDLKYRDPNIQRDQLIQLEALARQGEKQNDNEIYEPSSNKTKVIFTIGNRSNFTSQLRQIDTPVSMQSASTAYGSRINSENKLENRIYNKTSFENSADQLNLLSSSNKRPYRIKKMYVNRGSLNNLNKNLNLNSNNRPNETEDNEKRFKFIHVPAKLIMEKDNLKAENSQKDEYKNENYLIRQDNLETSNTIDQVKFNKIAKYEDNNLIELANQKQIIKVFPLGRVSLNDNLNADASSNQLSTDEYLKKTTFQPSTTFSLTNYSSSSPISSTATSIK